LTKGARVGDLIVVAGGRTGRDGIHGATFSSAELTDTHADEFAHAVQIGNAIEQKKLLDAMLLARDHADGCLYSAVTDCGAGGLSSAVGEMGAELGAVVDLEKAPLKYAGLRYDEIWISEAQERMVFAVPPDRWPAFQRVFADEEVEATALGRFTGDRMLCLRYRGTCVGELEMNFLHDGRPSMSRRATWAKEDADFRAGSASDRFVSSTTNGANRSPAKARLRHALPALMGTTEALGNHSANERLLDALSNLNVASKEWVIRQYDHEVQGRSVIKPLVGVNSGPSNAAVLRPRFDSNRGIALACGLCPHVSDIDPYWMAVLAVDEALRNVICVGADPERTSILDNFCWPKVDTEESLGALVRTCQGAHDAAVAYGLPFISGKDSLNNQFSMSAAESARTGLPQQLAIPPTLLVSALGMVNDVRRCISMDLKEPGSCLVLASAPVDEVGFEAAIAMHRRVASMIASGQVRAAHDVSDGGLWVAIAEMCIASGLGAIVEASLVKASRSAYVSTTYVLEVDRRIAIACELPILGEVTADPRLVVRSDERRAIDLSVEELSRAWKSPLANGGGHGHA
jgi:phosphoribosylformylglycinamidine synthase